MCRGGLLLDLYSDGRESFADLAHPRIRPQRGQPACYCLIKRFGSDFDGVVYTVKVFTRYAADSRRHPAKDIIFVVSSPARCRPRF